MKVKLEKVSIAISIVAFLISLSSLLWTYYIDTKIHRPYIGMNSLNVRELFSSTTDIIVSVPLKNFGDLPARYSIKMIFPPFIKNYPLNGQEGYLMPGQEQIFQWSIPINNNFNLPVIDLNADLCKGISQSKIIMNYGADEISEHTLQLSATLVKKPLSSDELYLIGNQTMGSSTTVFNCNASYAQSVIWVLTNSK